MNAIARWSWAAMVLACAVNASCYEGTSGHAHSGNTNWLRVCVADSSCGADASCVCGVCTRACDRAAECGASGEPAECVDPGAGAVDNDCAAQVTAEHSGICLRACAADRDCGADQSCEDGSCVASAATGSSTVSEMPEGGLAGGACDPTQQSCDSSAALAAVIEHSRNATLPSDPDARVWSCEAGALRVDPAGYDDAFAVAVAAESLLVAGVATAHDDGAWRIERRLMSDLAPAVEFGAQGAVTSGTTAQWDAASALVADSMFMYVAGLDGFGMPEGMTMRVEKRALASGALAAEFGAGGAIEPFGGAPVQLSPESGLGHALAIDATSLYLGGAAFGVEKRRLSDGALVAEFGEGGIASSAAAPESVASAVALRDGVLYTAGAEGLADLRLEARDAGTGALLYAQTEDFVDQGCMQCVALATGDDDDLYLAVAAAGRWRIERRQRSLGTLVYAKELAPASSCDAAAAIALDDSAMYVAGLFGERWRIEKRSLADGELVEAFGQGGVIETGLPGAASAIALQGDVLYVAGIEGPRAGTQSSVWRIERRSAADGSLIECPAGAPAVPRAPECGSKPVFASAPPSEGAACDARIASSNACAAVNVRASTAASSVEDWVLPEGAALDDGSLSTVELADEPSSFLLLRGFGLALPEGARVLGITVDVTRVSMEADSIADHAVRLVKGGLILDADRSLPDAWGAGDTQAKHGGPSDLWDSSWTAAEINDPSFGVALRVRALPGALQREAHFDAVRVNVHYCE